MICWVADRWSHPKAWTWSLKLNLKPLNPLNNRAIRKRQSWVMRSVQPIGLVIFIVKFVLPSVTMTQLTRNSICKVISILTMSYWKTWKECKKYTPSIPSSSVFHFLRIKCQDYVKFHIGVVHHNITMDSETLLHFL